MIHDDFLWIFFSVEYTFSADDSHLEELSVRQQRFILHPKQIKHNR